LYPFSVFENSDIGIVKIPSSTEVLGSIPHGT
jgi:hypothetical protein